MRKMTSKQGMLLGVESQITVEDDGVLRVEAMSHSAKSHFWQVNTASARYLPTFLSPIMLSGS